MGGTGLNQWTPFEQLDHPPAMEVGAGRKVETVSDASTKSKEKELARTVKMPSLPACAVADHREAVPQATKRPFQMKQRPGESIG